MPHYFKDGKSAEGQLHFKNGVRPHMSKITVTGDEVHIYIMKGNSDVYELLPGNVIGKYLRTDYRS